jgi:dethiobiotin synthase
MTIKNSFFITGTDTGIGKTYVSRLLADTIAANEAVTYMKPVQTGCSIDKSGNVKAPDFDYVMSGKAVMTGTYEQHVPYRFEPACSPHLAAELSGVIISFDRIKQCFAAVAQRRMPVIIEGAGGAFVPLTATTYTADLIQYLGVPAILVTSPRLGTLNHTFLTLHYLHSRNIPLAGIILNNHSGEPEGFIYNDNRRMIREHTLPLPFLEVHHGTSCGNDAVREFCRDIGCPV